MSIKYTTLSLFFLLITFNCVFSQTSNIVSVSPYTGTANVAIPIYMLNRGAVSCPITLYYNATGVKVQDQENSAGIGWQLEAGGQITRQVRGLPDDCQKDNYGVARLGWLYNSNATKISNFTIANDNSNSTCTDETADINYINANFGDLSDTEPDIFYVNAPGLSCKFVFDNIHQIRTIPYQDLKITYITDPTVQDRAYGQITSFTVTNDKGVQYTFAVAQNVTQTAVQGAYGTGNPANIKFFKTDYNLYKNGITYNEKWFLQSVQDANGNGMHFTYTTDPIKYESNPITLLMGGAGNTTTKSYQYTISKNHNNPQVLQQIRSFKDLASISFAWGSNGTNGSDYVETIIAGGKVISFGYDNLSNYNDGYRRYFLTSLQGASPIDYQFSYAGYVPYVNTILPDSTTKQIDFWGYYSNVVQNTALTPALYINPLNSLLQRYQVQATGTVGTDYTYSLTGSGRTVDPANVMAGTLNQITYSTGGTTALTYESNDYYDAAAHVVVKGGGVRIKQVVDYDGMNVANNITRKYSYINPATGLSSGKPVTLPIYAFTTGYTGGGTQQDIWNYSTVRSETDLSSEDESIVYGNVKLSQTGAGSIAYQYTSPATNWDNYIAPDWHPTVNNFARSSCLTSSYPKNDIYSYPFAPNPNYEFERGLLQQVTTYNDAGQEVSESDYTYQRTGLPLIITGLKIDYNQADVVYAKYGIFTGCSELTTQETKKIFDSQTLSQAQVSTVSYTYGSTYHKLPTLVTSTNSDGSIKTAKIQYTKDYVIPSTTDPNLLAIQGLQALNINLPVEKQAMVQRSGTTKTISAELTRYNSFTGRSGPIYMPSQKLTFTASNGVTNFLPSASGTGVFTYDPRYVPVTNFTAYDNSGFLLTEDDNNKHVQTAFFDHNIGAPVLTAANAAWNELAFNNFEYGTGINGPVFTKTVGPTNLTTACHTGGNALILETGGVLSAPVHKNVQAKNYIYSCWVSSTSTPTMTVIINSSGVNTSYPLSISDYSGAWKYYEMKIPVSTVAADFTISLNCSAQVNIDDVLFYPEMASVTTLTYDPTTYKKTSETNTDGITTYYAYDKFERLTYAYDQSKNILLRNAYVKYGALPPPPYINLLFGTSYYPDQPYPGYQITFNNESFLTNPNLNITDLTYSWNYGDGATSNGTNGSHIYASAGTYTVTLTANSLQYGQVVYTQAFVVIPLPAATISLTSVNLSTGGTISRVKLYQGSQLIYSIIGATLGFTGGYKIIPGRYDVQVTTTGTTSNLNSFTYVGSFRTCFPYNAGSLYSFSDNITSPATFIIDINTCTGTLQHQ